MSGHAAAKSLQRGELAGRTGCNIETVRYYEKIGLLPEPPRTSGGHRAYSSTHERRLRFVLRVGFESHAERANRRIMSVDAAA
ncbi:MerR family DNA-binding transcriptional regulator [Sphingopyxis sp. SE2]|uniref:MerR family DNA-binding transcriptional regulator n=1 Tax=Sphingopyxis sp. SE2 TaxID=1586240 RepID=UPI0028C27B15|nr:MerR family DNA-binding transcriptional regulator [Sphingopyxis sp. SE2]MDT7531473.1 MerR family DNA-binding transcriptional regulator [Sphingopyxis sp. SE2]